MAYQFEDIKDSVVIVTGSGRGIGRGTAKLFAEHGAKVVVHDIDADVAKEAEEEIKAMGVETMSAVCDVRDREAVNKMITDTVEKFGKLDTLVNNAGITKDGLFLRMKEEDLNFILDVNINGTFFAAQAAANVMRKARKGSIINLSSLVRNGAPGQTNYSTAKAGVAGFTRALAKEIAAYGIRVNCVAPGFVVTRLTDAVPEKMREAYKKQIPLGRTGEAEDIAKPILFLASDLSSYMTGQVLDVNGGLM